MLHDFRENEPDLRPQQPFDFLREVGHVFRFVNMFLENPLVDLIRAKSRVTHILKSFPQFFVAHVQ
jgi:hypothetical protein